MKITKGTIIRTVMVVIVVLNAALRRIGIDVININENALSATVSAVVEIAAIAAAWWYNNSFTEKAKKADRFFKALKESDNV